MCCVCVLHVVCMVWVGIMCGGCVVWCVYVYDVWCLWGMVFMCLWIPQVLVRETSPGFHLASIEHIPPGCSLENIYYSNQFASSLGHGGSQLAGTGPEDPSFSHPNGHEFALAGG